jgi:peptidoglycan/LPS O-acetylase OafA/YrhL
MKMKTIGSVLSVRRGIGPGFDFLRVFLASGIVFWHTDTIVNGSSKIDAIPIVWAIGFGLLVAFFCLSGFLITASALRLSLGNFLINRGLRIVPALAVEIFLSALVLGPVFTDLSLAKYFTDRDFFHYFTNIVGIINYHLPGVFEKNPLDIVNTTLWTVPHEISCYLIMSGLIVGGLLKYPKAILGLIACFYIATLIVALTRIDQGAGIVAKLADRFFVGYASRLYIAFVVGIALYVFRDRIPYSYSLFGICTLYVLFVSLWPQPLDDSMLANFLLIIPLCYMTIFVGVTDIWMPEPLRKGDYSYGIYLYGWPIQQMLVAVLPDLKSTPLHFIIALPLITLFSAFSWHYIEKPILVLRKKFSFVATVRLEESAAPGDTRFATKTSA